jgi:ATP/maltotriose-dependent transcriptional regulator MalT
VLEADLPALRDVFPRSSARSAAELALAEAWIAMGRIADARPMLADAAAHRKSELGTFGDPRALLPVWRVDAQLARAAGDPERALAGLAAVPPDALQWSDVEPISIEIERSHALRLLGRTNEAAAAARRAIGALQVLPATHPMPGKEAAAEEALAAAELTLGHRDEARAAYARALALRRVHDVEDSATQAEDERTLTALVKTTTPRVGSR